METKVTKKKTAKDFKPGEHMLSKYILFTSEIFVEKLFILTEALISNMTEESERKKFNKRLL
jgi:hypothetical protein